MLLLKIRVRKKWKGKKREKDGKRGIKREKEVKRREKEGKMGKKMIKV